MNIYRNDTRNKKRHAEQEKERRARLNSVYKEQEKARNKTDKRIEWKRKYNPEYYREHRDSILSYHRNYKSNNKEKLREADLMRKRIKKEDAKTFSIRDWHNILEKYGWKCFYCHKDLDNPEKDHMIPITRGGRATTDNIVPACHSCNCRKNDRNVEEYREYLISIGETPVF
jgi:hypothetical protein